MSTDVCGPTLAAQITRVLAANDAASGVQTAIEPPGDGVGYWAGGPSAVYVDGTFWVAYRLRRPVDQGRGFANVLARVGARRRRRVPPVRQLLDVALQALVS
jgi:hypothetical protein